MEYMADEERTVTQVPPLRWTRVGDWEVRLSRGASMAVVVFGNGKLGLPCECCVEVRRVEAWRPETDRG